MQLEECMRMEGSEKDARTRPEPDYLVVRYVNPGTNIMSSSATVRWWIIWRTVEEPQVARVITRVAVRAVECVYGVTILLVGVTRTASRIEEKCRG